MKEAAKYKRMHEEALDLCKRYIVHLHTAERERDEARADLSVAMSRIEAIARELGCDAQTMVEDPSVAWAELERVKTSCRMWSADMYEAGDLCNRHGNEMPIDAVRRFVSSKTAIVDMLQDRLSEARAEVDRLKREPAVHPSNLTDVVSLLEDERDELLVRVANQDAELRAAREAYRDAYRRGAEAMRDECIGAACGFYMGTTGFCNGDEDELEAVLEALPIPEEPTNG